MLNPRLAGRYAKSLLDLAVERGELDALYNDCITMQRISKVSPEFAAMLKSPVIKAEQKSAVINAVVKGKVSNMMEMFLTLLTKKSREYFLPEILTAFIAEHDRLKEINHIILKTAIPVSEQVQQSIKAKIEADTQLTNIHMISVVDEGLIGGYVLEYNNNLIDSSVRKYLKEVKSQFLSNDYIFNVR